jgi:hypothetical protein
MVTADPYIANGKPHEMHLNARLFLLFLADATRLGDFSSTNPCFLLKHAIELALMSYLHNKGRALEELCKRPFSHDLTVLLREARTSGLGVSNADTDDVLIRLNEVTQEASLRHELANRLPLFQDAMRVAHALLADTAPHLPSCR